jgi:pyrroloquinoline quinone biosynthesis protein E
MVRQFAPQAVNRSSLGDAEDSETECAYEIGVPLGLLAELTHRCPLHCAYCSNPLRLLKAADELPTEVWLDAFSQAADMGVLQAHLSGGEPTLRADLEDMVAHLARRGVYSNLITAGVTLTRDRIFALRDLGLDHLKLSFQGMREDVSFKVGRYEGGYAKKLAVAGWARQAGLPLTINAPIHRYNIDDTRRLLDFCVRLGAERVEITHIQYYGWGFHNKAALLPSYEKVIREAGIVREAKERLKGVLNIDYVTPDCYARYPKPCMGGWAWDALTLTPDGSALPCHAAGSIEGMTFDRITERRLADIWVNGEAFNRFRGADWMIEPCASCERKLLDFGGCRCQAMAITGDARNADPACSLSPHHESLWEMAEKAAASEPPEMHYRRIGEFV